MIPNKRLKVLNSVANFGRVYFIGDLYMIMELTAELTAVVKGDLRPLKNTRPPKAYKRTLNFFLAFYLCEQYRVKFSRTGPDGPRTYGRKTLVDFGRFG